MNFSVLSVSQINYYIKSIFESDDKLSSVFISGEISNLADSYKSGHIYFSLKDSKAVIRCVMFAYNAKRLKFILKDGMKILLRGKISVYEATGQYQVYVEDMQPDGVGAVTLAFEQLKEKLLKEGLFNDANKKQLPKFPNKIGVITSKNGAVIEDIKNVLNRRYKLAKILLCPVSVQGENSAKEMIKALKYLDKNKLCDVIIIGRGGGSAEDLWSFNDENLARCIYSLNTPVVSAVGHETDFTITDFVADVRAATPSMAAEIVSPEEQKLKIDINNLKENMISNLNYKINLNREKIKRLNQNLLLRHPQKTLEKNIIECKELEKRLKNAYSNKLNYERYRLSLNIGKLETLSPLKILSRGYSLTYKDSKIIKNANELSADDTISIKFASGESKCKVLEVSYEEKCNL